jgi:aryl-alcohol dehydrogenase-like predicted oxidoreductase
MWSRRAVLGLTGVLAARALARGAPVSTILQRPIPSSGELVPAIGLGSWQTFDTADPPALQPVLARFLALGGRVVDTSPMYGRAEAAIGAMAAAIRRTDRTAPAPWLATKVWTTGKAAGIAQLEQSLARLGVAKLELAQIHNLVDWKNQLATLRDWKAAGKVRYIGITHYAAPGELEAVLRAERGIDFVQLPYSAAQRGAERRLLPAAADRGAAVLVMEPFASGALFKRVKNVALPGVARDLECTSWAQLFLKLILAHPAVTCPIPATSKVAHVEDNLGALRGPVPTPAQRDAIAAAISRA